MRRILVFHRTIAPYRIDFFNDLSGRFEARICLQYKNLISQKFDYERISKQLTFKPIYLNILFRLKGRVINSGYWSHLNDFKPDIVIVGEFGIEAILMLLHRFFTRKKYRIVSICDDSYNMVAEDNDFSFIHRISRKIIAPRLDDLILIEPKVVEWYRFNYGKGLLFPIIKHDDRAREDYQRVFSLSQKTVVEYSLTGKCVFLFVGRLVALKNVETIINAFSNLSTDKNVLVIVGEGSEEERLRQMAKETKCNIFFTGRLEGDKLNVWYNIADCFVLASYQEAFGAVTNEALLAGCYGLISCKAGSQCLIEDGVNGWTFNPMDADELTAKMIKVANVIGESSRMNGLKDSKMLFRYEDLMNRLINQLQSMT